MKVQIGDWFVGKVPPWNQPGDPVMWGYLDVNPMNPAQARTGTVKSIDVIANKIRLQYVGKAPNGQLTFALHKPGESQPLGWACVDSAIINEVLKPTPAAGKITSGDPSGLILKKGKRFTIDVAAMATLAGDRHELTRIAATGQDFKIVEMDDTRQVAIISRYCGYDADEWEIAYVELRKVIKQGGI